MQIQLGQISHLSYTSSIQYLCCASCTPYHLRSAKIAYIFCCRIGHSRIGIAVDDQRYSTLQLIQHHLSGIKQKAKHLRRQQVQDFKHLERRPNKCYELRVHKRLSSPHLGKTYGQSSGSHGGTQNGRLNNGQTTTRKLSIQEPSQICPMLMFFLTYFYTALMYNFILCTVNSQSINQSINQPLTDSTTVKQIH